MKAISIILPVYNVEKYIQKCLDSIINQSFKNFELIIIDDCGNDNSIELCKLKLDNSKIDFRIINNIVNKGISASRNIGIRNSRADYILYIDSDDWIHPCMLEKLYTAAIDDDADLVSCVAMEFWEASSTFTEMQNIKKGTYTPIEYLNYLFIGDTSSHLCFKLIKRHLFKDVEFPEKVIFEDVLTMPYLVKNANKIIQLEDILYYYLKRNSYTSITGSKPTNINGFLFYLKRLQNEFKSTSGINKLYFLRFIYKILFVITYSYITFSKNYSEIKLELRSISSFLRLNELFVIRKALKFKFVGYMLLLKLNSYSVYKAQKILIIK